MRVWIAVALVGLIALPAAAVPRGTRLRKERRSTPAFELAPGGSGGGVSNANVNGFCEQFVSEMTGNYFCKDGDSSSGLTLTAVGSPATQTDSVCTNGANCNSVTNTRLNSGSYFSSPAEDYGDDFSFCSLVNLDVLNSAGSYQTFGGKGSGAVGDYWRLTRDTAGAVNFYIYNAVGSSTAASLGGGTTQGSWQFWCGTYDFVGAGTSIQRLYRDGTEVGSTTSGVALRTGGTQPINIGSIAGGLDPLLGRFGAAFYTQKILTPATITAMASALLPTVQGGRGETLTVSRASVRSCCKSDGTACSILPANRACFHDGALDVSGDVAQLMTRSAEFDDASWVKTSASVTANSTIAPDGTLTADTLVGSAAAGRFEKYATVTGTSAAGSIYVRSVSGTQAGVFKLYNTTAGSAVCTVNYTATTTWQQISCGGAITSGNSVGPVMYTGDTVSTFGSVVVWGAQVTASSVALPYCPSFSTPTTCLGELTTTPATSAWPVGSGKMVIRYTPATSTLAASAGLLRALDGTTTGWQLQRTSGNTLQFNGWVSAVNTPITSGVLTWTPGQTYVVRVEWTPSAATMWRDDVQIASGAFVTVPALGATASVGDNLGANTSVQGLISIDSVSK